MKKEQVIEFIEFNFLMSLVDFFKKEFEDKVVHNKKMNVVQSYSDMHIAYTSPSFSVEVLNRKNRTAGFNNFLGEVYSDDEIIDMEGLILEYSIQLNVYSNTRGENHKWNSILDETLINSENIPLNIYSDNGNIIKENAGIIYYDYSTVKNNNMPPNVVTYDFHSIYDVKMNVVQKYKLTFDIMKISNIYRVNENNEIIEEDIEQD